ncbi:SIR2 family protein [Leifsonia sp. NPDC058292]|uniref:SIR2 family protein n=1 Tax=Leifsonia sp. NPDC058292 TaxID=3346428 RepID=UPI0036DE5DA5
MTSLASAPFHEGCAVCGTHFPIDIPDELVEAAKNRDLVVFAGAGISTERPQLFPETFYEEVEARLRDEPSGKSFPEVMQEFEDAFGRRELIRAMLDRIDYVSTFQSLQSNTTAFHSEIASISQLNAILTTNWDDFFERFSGARPFVLDEDFAFFDLPGRRVLKLHGSMSNLSSIVATTSDYTSREEDLARSVMGAKLRDFLATKVILFVGYSLTDSDFESIYRSVIERMGRFRRHAFIVTPVDTGSAVDFGLTHLKTDGGHFAHLLKRRLEDSGHHIPDERLDRAEWIHRAVLAAHVASEKLLENPNVFGGFTQAYQDGILAALGRVRLMRHKGEYSDPQQVRQTVSEYAHSFAETVADRRYFDACYVEGYMLGTRSLLLSDDELRNLPIIETFGSPIFRSKRPDPHGEVEVPWWVSRPEWTLAEFIQESNRRGGDVGDWLARAAAATRSRGGRSPGLAVEHKQILAGLRPGQVPQHSEFL